MATSTPIAARVETAREREASPPRIRPEAPHVPALDGLRGLAILLVLLVHTSIVSGVSGTSLSMAIFTRVASAGWCGVDLFFVISGYLITGILWDSRDSRHYYRNFYARRTLRIFPLYYAFLAWGLLVGPLVSGEWPAFTTGWFWLYLSNYYIALHPTVVPAAFMLTWSLAIEEQFYLVWPFSIRNLGRQAVFALCTVMIVAAPVLRMALLSRGFPPYAPYMFTFARVDALAIGAFIATASRSRGGFGSLYPWARRAGLASTGGIAAICVWRGGLGHTDPVVQILGLTFIALLSGSLLILLLSGRAGSILTRSFEARWLRAFGKYSYAIYLLHLPVLLRLQGLFGRFRVQRWMGSEFPTQLLFSAVGSGLVLCVAWISWQCYEKHWLGFKRFFPRAG